MFNLFLFKNVNIIVILTNYHKPTQVHKQSFQDNITLILKSNTRIQSYYAEITVLFKFPNVKNKSDTSRIYVNQYKLCII